MANNSNRKAIEFMVQGVLPPHSTNVLWMDTSVPALPVLKIFENGAWATVHTGDSKAIELLSQTVLAQQNEITELTEDISSKMALDATVAKDSTVAKQQTLTQGIQNISNAIANIDTSNLAKETTLQAVEQDASAAKVAAQALVPVAAAAEAYNTGKTELAANITAKGVQASATETLPELADKVSLIRQNTYEINGGEIFETQLYGAPTSVENVDGLYVQTGGSLWNLYEVMAQLKSDARFIGYGGILLAEYFKGYDTIELMNVGAGGAYFTCDGDFYMTDRAGENVHVWHDNENGMMNRWVAYLFAAEGTNYTIPSTNLCPRAIHIGRKVGTIICSVAGRIREIVVGDDDELYGTNFSSTQVWQQEVVIKNIKNATDGCLINENSNIVSLDVDLENITDESKLFSNSIPNLSALSLKKVRTFGGTAISSRSALFTLPKPLSYIMFNPEFIPTCALFSCNNTSVTVTSENIVIEGLKKVNGLVTAYASGGRDSNIKKVTFLDAEDVLIMPGSIFSADARINNMREIIGKKIKKFDLGSIPNSTQNLYKIEVGALEYNCNCAVWNPTDVLSTPEGIAQINANIRDYIAANVTDGNNTLTFTVSTNLLNNLEQATLDAFATKHWLVAGV